MRRRARLARSSSASARRRVLRRPRVDAIRCLRAAPTNPPPGARAVPAALRRVGSASLRLASVSASLASARSTSRSRASTWSARSDARGRERLQIARRRAHATTSTPRPERVDRLEIGDIPAPGGDTSARTSGTVARDLRRRRRGRARACVCASSTSHRCGCRPRQPDVALLRALRTVVARAANFGSASSSPFVTSSVDALVAHPPSLAPSPIFPLRVFHVRLSPSTFAGFPPRRLQKKTSRVTTASSLIHVVADRTVRDFTAAPSQQSSPTTMPSRSTGWSFTSASGSKPWLKAKSSGTRSPSRALGAGDDAATLVDVTPRVQRHSVVEESTLNHS